MDSKLLPWLAAGGWLLITLGIWGWIGSWWAWPLSAGLALLLVAGVGKWVHVLQLRAMAAKRIPVEVET